MLSVYSFNRPLWRYGSQGLGGGGDGDGIVGEEGSPLASFSACFSLFFCHSVIYCTPSSSFLLSLSSSYSMLGMSMSAEIPHGDAEDMNEV